ncbi:MAG: transglycosylase domain-containing protein [Bacteroidales bacterium]|nr:transglycosylase domain-containing protein [Bacteroidales bacterium]
MAKGKTGRNFIRFVWLMLIVPLVLIMLLFFAVSLGWFGQLPTFTQLENPKSSLASEVYSADNVLLGKYFFQNRSNVRYNELSPNIINALVATEDYRFPKHSGIDFKSLFRVITKNILFGNKKAGGGSTISQQLAKNLFPREKDPPFFKLVIIKLKEWITAIKLERNYTKEEIVAMYLSTVDFGNLSYGIKSAAKTYFNTTPAALKTEQAAMLVGLLKAPSWFNPVRNYDRALKRREVVLHQMCKYNYINEKQYDSLKTLPIDLSRFKIQDHTEGLATYLREYLRGVIAEWCNNHLKADGTPYNLYRDGLKIYTTINSKMQKYAEEAVAEHLKELQKEFYKHWKGIKNAPFDEEMEPEMIKEAYDQAIKRSDRYQFLKAQGYKDFEISKIFRQPVKMKVFSWKGAKDTTMSPMDSIKYYKYFLLSGLMSVEPRTGYVRAYVGGINYKYFQYDHVISGKRQVGSTFKPFLYTLAMQEGEFTPCSKVPNISVSFENPGGEPWTPKNSSEAREGEMVTLKWALANSINNVSAYLMKRYKPEAVVQVARKMGITSPIPAVPSICLGSVDLSLYEMVGAYSTFANKGRWIEPILITRIEDKSGNVLETFSPKTSEAFNENTAFLMLDLMKGVCLWGTGARLRYRYNFSNPIAGKTGTTQNNSDGWFIGIVPQLVTGIWVGCEDRSVHFRSTDFGQGATMALPIWALYMKKVLADRSLKIRQDDFDGIEKVSSKLNCNTDDPEKKENEIDF